MRPHDADTASEVASTRPLALTARTANVLAAVTRPIRVSKPPVGEVATNLGEPPAVAASTCQRATSVAPFQLA